MLLHPTATLITPFAAPVSIRMPRISAGVPIEPLATLTDWFPPPTSIHPASSHSALERSGVASWWSNHNPTLTGSEAHFQERFKAVKMSAWLKAQFEQPLATSLLLCRLCLRILPGVHNAGMLVIEEGKLVKHTRKHLTVRKADAIKRIAVCFAVVLSKVQHQHDEDVIKTSNRFLVTVTIIYSYFCIPSALVSHFCCTKVMRGMKMNWNV